MLQNVLVAFHDAVSLLLRHSIEKRSVLENLDLVVLALDETVDDGCVLKYSREPLTSLNMSADCRYRYLLYCIVLYWKRTLRL